MSDQNSQPLPQPPFEPDAAGATGGRDAAADGAAPLDVPPDPLADMFTTEAEVAASASVESGSPFADWEGQLAEARDRNLRLQAELDNFRKRMMRTAEEERRYAALPLMRDLLPVVDNLQRAMQAAEQHENAAGLLAGVKLVAGQLEAVLQRHHCAPIEAYGVVFDPHLHEAIAQHPSEEHPPGHVCLVAQPGYQLHDRVIRPAQVIVAAPRAAGADEPDDTKT